MSIPKMNWKVISILLIGSLFLSSCGSIDLEKIMPSFGKKETGPMMVEVKFFVQVPLNTPEDEIIYLSTLDEVTGLGVNAQAHPLEPVIGEENLDQGLLYSTTLTVPQHTIIKYRYTRQNQYAIIEHTNIDEQVRYRIAKVDNPLEVRDVVSKWSDTEYIWPEPGRISGFISDATNGTPLPGLLVTAGGVQAFTTASGSYLLTGLPPGIHNLLVYSPDGSYEEIQQGAEIATQANTQANLSLYPRDFVDVTFLVAVPVGTPEDSIRLAGNLFQLGNTFGNLPGGMNTIPSRMPKLTHAGDNKYGIILSLPVGAEIRYKYSLGDGFWNSEHEEDGSFKIRRIIIPDQPTQINDEVLTWKSGPKESITFDLWTPENTPPWEDIYIQFNPYGWTTPLPMNELEPNHWVFILYSPFDILSGLTYRYCRESQCGIADDLATPGYSPPGREVTPGAEPQYIADSVDNWVWLEESIESDPIPLPEIESRGDGFYTGVEVMPGIKAGDSDHITTAIPEILATNAEYLILTPTWSFTHKIPPVIEPNPNQDPLWQDLSSISSTAQAYGFEIAIHPQPHFPESPDDWWISAPLDFSWWNSWFDQYYNFALHFAEAAEQQGADILILGGDWLMPALPGGKLANGDPSGVPADSELRWKKIIEDVQEHFSGTLAWTLSIPEKNLSNEYLSSVDQIHLNWNPDIVTSESSSLEELIFQANTSLDTEVQEFWSAWTNTNNKELVLRIAYPSVSGWNINCLQDEDPNCYDLSSFATPAPDIPELSIDFDLQARVYTALLSSITRQNWVSGIISRGYYSPVILHDKSISIHGKPAETVLSQWFGGLR